MPTTSDDESEKELPNVGEKTDACICQEDRVVMAINNGSFGYSDVKAVLHDINVEILRGKVHMLIGPYVNLP